jgi:hypothetical protein
MSCNRSIYWLALMVRSRSLLLGLLAGLQTFIAFEYRNALEYSAQRLNTWAYYGNGMPRAYLY